MDEQAPSRGEAPTLRVTVSLLALGWATKHVLQQILGLFASVFVSSRDFCVFHDMCKFLEELMERNGLSFRILYRKIFRQQ